MPGDVDHLNGKKPRRRARRARATRQRRAQALRSGEPRLKVRCHDYVHCAVKPGHPPLSLVESPAGDPWSCHLAADVDVTGRGP